MCEDYRRAQMIARCRYVAVTSLRPLEGPRKIRSQHVIEAALFTACGDPTRRMGRAVHTDWVSPAREIEGRDHLAMQAVSGRLYNGLRPGLTNVTLRARCYSFITRAFASHCGIRRDDFNTAARAGSCTASGPPSTCVGIGNAKAASSPEPKIKLQAST